MFSNLSRLFPKTGGYPEDSLDLLLNMLEDGNDGNEQLIKNEPGSNVEAPTGPQKKTFLCESCQKVY